MIDVKLVTNLINSQFPEFSELEIKPVKDMGHDNRTFHLGEEMSIRLPSHENYESQILKENKYLPFLAKSLSFPISTPIKIGQPEEIFPFHWSINKWLEGRTYQKGDDIAKQLALALKELQNIDATSGPLSGKQNFYRGCSLTYYHDETIESLKKYPNPLFLTIWNLGVNSKYSGEGKWVHGDVAPGNILIKDNSFYALIDFGVMGVGDPACDLVMAWTSFNKQERDVFFEYLSCDKGMINRGRCWALWKALITDDLDTLKRIEEEYIFENRH